MEICNFLVLLASHNYISCRLSQCGIARQTYFSLQLSYYGETVEAGLANCFTADDATSFVEGIGQLSLLGSLLGIFGMGRIESAMIFGVDIFLLNDSIAFEKDYRASPE